MLALRWLGAVAYGFFAGFLCAIVSNLGNEARPPFYNALLGGLAFGTMFLAISVSTAPSRSKAARSVLAGLLALAGAANSVVIYARGYGWVYTLSGFTMIAIAGAYAFWVTFEDTRV